MIYTEKYRMKNVLFSFFLSWWIEICFISLLEILDGSSRRQKNSRILSINDLKAFCQQTTRVYVNCSIRQQWTIKKDLDFRRHSLLLPFLLRRKDRKQRQRLISSRSSEIFYENVKRPTSFVLFWHLLIVKRLSAKKTISFRSIANICRWREKLV